MIDSKNNSCNKIFYVITKAEIGGAQNHIELLIMNLPDPCQLVLCCGSGGSLIEDLSDFNVKTHIVPELNSKSFFPAFIALFKLIKAEQPDLIHTHSAIASFVGRIAGWFVGVKTLYTVHGWHFVPNSVPQRRILGWLLELVARPFTDAWITVSKYDKQLGVSSRVVDADRTWVIPNGIEDIPYKRNLKRSDNLNLVFVGRASYQKNCLEAIDVLERCDSQVHLTMFVTTGDHLSALQQCIEASSAGKRVTLIADNPDAAEHMQEYDGMLLTSRYEGMPLCVLEAMRTGLPVVASNVCGLNELVKHNENGFLYSLHDLDEAASCVNKLLDMELRLQFGSCARQRFEENFLAKQMAQRTNEIYKKLLND